ncbi:UNVERIFIED_CONTAM: hypothetical protein HHA_451570 [Hammondia hammondi]|eukprot:XP_008884420.1 hypothetical protein HHA_451570 [Hammondia hammondi]
MGKGNRAAEGQRGESREKRSSGRWHQEKCANLDERTQHAKDGGQFSCRHAHKTATYVRSANGGFDSLSVLKDVTSSLQDIFQDRMPRNAFKAKRTTRTSHRAPRSAKEKYQEEVSGAYHIRLVR